MAAAGDGQSGCVERRATPGTSPLSKWAPAVRGTGGERGVWRGVEMGMLQVCWECERYALRGSERVFGAGLFRGESAQAAPRAETLGCLSLSPKPMRHGTPTTRAVPCSVLTCRDLSQGLLSHATCAVLALCAAARLVHCVHC
eukprot:703897-Rhodomonas_salina.7